MSKRGENGECVAGFFMVEAFMVKFLRDFYWFFEDDARILSFC